MADDIVRDFLRRARQLHPETAPEEWQRLEVSLRETWGGERVYVLKVPTLGKGVRLGECLAAGAGLREAMRTVGLRPSTGYRILRRTWCLR